MSHSYLINEQIKEKGETGRTKFESAEPLRYMLIIFPMNEYCYIVITILQMRKPSVREASLALGHPGTQH